MQMAGQIAAARFQCVTQMRRDNELPRISLRGKKLPRMRAAPTFLIGW
jgi:hypothetical protein